MSYYKRNAAYLLALTFVAAVAFIYLFIAIGLVPYWQEMSGVEIQAWWEGPFTRFSYLMVPIHFLSIITHIYAYVLHRRGPKPFDKLWLLALSTLLICQAFNFGLHGSIYNPSLQSGTLEPAVALETFDNWDVYHTVRTISVCISLVTLVIIGMRSAKT
ncbi:MAG: hypothetical protein AAF694_05925 [Bacteroidota bacterium]